MNRTVPSPTIGEVTEAIKEARDAYAEYAEHKKISDTFWERFQLKEGAVLAMLQASNSTKFYAEDIGNVSIVESFAVTTPKTTEEKRALYDYICGKYGKDSADGSITYNHNTLQSFWKRESEAEMAAGNAAFRLPGVGEPRVQYSMRGLRPKGSD